MSKGYPTALLMIRTWREDEAERPFRAQIHVSTDLSAGLAPTINVADPDRVLEIVRTFLEGPPPARIDAS